MFKNEKYSIFFSIWVISLIILVALIIIVGGLTRLTDSGLSITRWELFKGILPPLSSDQWEAYFLAYKTIPQYIYLNTKVLALFDTGTPKSKRCFSLFFPRQK